MRELCEPLPSNVPMWTLPNLGGHGVGTGSRLCLCHRLWDGWVDRAGGPATMGAAPSTELTRHLALDPKAGIEVVIDQAVPPNLRGALHGICAIGPKSRIIFSSCHCLRAWTTRPRATMSKMEMTMTVRAHSLTLKPGKCVQYSPAFRGGKVGHSCPASDTTRDRIMATVTKTEAASNDLVLLFTFSPPQLRETRSGRRMLCGEPCLSSPSPPPYYRVASTSV